MILPSPDILGEVQWTKNPPQEPSPDGMPYATHYGEFVIMGKTLKVFKLSDGRRVFEAQGIYDLFEGMI